MTVRTRAQLKSDADEFLPDNDEALIEPEHVRQRIIDIADSARLPEDTISADSLTDGTTNKVFTAAEKTKLSGIEASADVTDAGNVGSSIHGASAKTTPVDADTLPLIDSAASNALKKVTWANIKATLKTYFDTLYSRSAFGLATSDSPQFAGINVGHASDTTITRVSAGVAAVEGSNILTANQIGSSVQGYDAATAKLNVEDQALTGGARVTSKSLGTLTTGTLTPDPGDRPLQHYTNNGAHTLAPGSNAGAYMLDITNGASAGAITISGWTKVEGSFTTTNGHKFRCHCSVGNAGSLLVIQALQ